MLRFSDENFVDENLYRKWNRWCIVEPSLMSVGVVIIKNEQKYVFIEFKCTQNIKMKVYKHKSSGKSSMGGWCMFQDKTSIFSQTMRIYSLIFSLFDKDHYNLLSIKRGIVLVKKINGCCSFCRRLFKNNLLQLQFEDVCWKIQLNGCFSKCLMDFSIWHLLIPTSCWRSWQKLIFMHKRKNSHFGRSCFESFFAEKYFA